MISWQSYLSRFVDNIREAYKAELLGEGLELEVLEKTEPGIKRTAFVKPCQIDVFEFSSVSKVLWIVRNEKNEPDKEFRVVEGIKESPRDFSTSKKYKKYDDAFSFAEWNEEDFGQHLFKDGPNILVSSSSHYDAMLFFYNPRETNPQDLVIHMFHRYRTSTFRSVERFRIEESTSKIRDEVKKSLKTEVSPPILNAMKSIEDSLLKLKKIDEHEQKLTSIEDEIVGVRRLIGTKTFGEWKTLLSEIDKLNARIDSVSNIKDAYDKVLAQQNEFMKQQAEVMKQQSSFINWIRYATILLPVAVISVPIIEVVSILIRHYLGIL